MDKMYKRNNINTSMQSMCQSSKVIDDFISDVSSNVGNSILSQSKRKKRPRKATLISNKIINGTKGTHFAFKKFKKGPLVQ